MTPDLLDALTELHGVTITVRHELQDAAMRLMGTLGVRVVVDSRAPECTAYAGHYAETLKPGGCRECARIEAAA